MQMYIVPLLDPTFKGLQDSTCRASQRREAKPLLESSHEICPRHSDLPRLRALRGGSESDSAVSSAGHQHALDPRHARRHPVSADNQGSGRLHTLARCPLLRTARASPCACTWPCSLHPEGPGNGQCAWRDAEGRRPGSRPPPPPPTPGVPRPSSSRTLPSLCLSILKSSRMEYKLATANGGPANDRHPPLSGCPRPSRWHGPCRRARHTRQTRRRAGVLHWRSVNEVARHDGWAQDRQGASDQHACLGRHTATLSAAQV